MATSYTNFSVGNANLPPNYVAADGFVGSPASNFNPSSPTFNAPNFPSGMSVTGGQTVAGGLTVSSGNLTVAPGAIVNSVQDSITASTTHTQAGAFALSAQCSRVTVVASAGDAVKAPYAATPGAWFEVINSAGVNSLQLYALGSDTLNGTAGTTGIAVAAGKQAIMTCYTAGAWIGPVALA